MKRNPRLRQQPEQPYPSVLEHSDIHRHGYGLRKGTALKCGIRLGRWSLTNWLTK
jgi:hypothetical protein